MLPRLLTSSNIRHYTYSISKCNKAKRDKRQTPERRVWYLGVGRLYFSAKSYNGEEDTNLIVLVKDDPPSFRKICI